MLIFIFIIIVLIAIWGSYILTEKKGLKHAIINVITSIALGVTFFYIQPFIPHQFQSSSNDTYNQITNEQKVNTQTNNETNISKQDTNPTTIDDQTNISPNKTEQEPNKQNNSDTNSNKLQNTVNYISDISKNKSVSGSISYKEQKDNYKYTAPITGTYRFDTNLSAGGEVRIRISGEQGNSLNDATNALTMDLEAGKTYILGVEYKSVPCDYTVNIGVPTKVTDVTNTQIISGSITYQDQKDNYKYTAPITGTYRFDTNLSAGGEVRIRISGEQGNSLNYDINALSIDLEAGKTYILGVEYGAVPCDYTVNINVPIEVTDITATQIISDSITYQDQKNNYKYTAPITGIYHFENKNVGGEVRIKISNKQGNIINYGTDELSVELEEGQTYIVGIEYLSSICDYTIKINIPNEVLDITGKDFAAGSLMYQDQENKYLYTATKSGTYCFDTALSTNGSVKLIINGSNDNYIHSDLNRLIVDLTAGNTYILIIKYFSTSCEYTINISYQ